MSLVAYLVRDTTDWAVHRIEQMGKKSKAWLVRPGALSDETGEPADPADLWLFKQVRADEQGERGEDWAEKAVAEICPLLGLPCATVDLATHPWQQGSPRGVICQNVLRPGQSLTHGNELLAAMIGGYDPDRVGVVSGYTVAASMAALDPYLRTTGFDDNGHGIRFQFAGYLILDALVNNTDRHHGNWAVTRGTDGVVQLAPSFDHASSLGFSERPDRKQRLLDGGRVTDWLDRGRTKFDGAPAPMTVAADAAAHLSDRGRREWRDRVGSVTGDRMSLTLDPMPDPPMSQVDRNFASEVLRINRERLLDVL